MTYATQGGGRWVVRQQAASPASWCMFTQQKKSSLVLAGASKPEKQRGGG